MISLAGAFAAHADGVSELASFSAFDKPDLALLAQGDAKPVRGPEMSTPRFLSVQTAWVSPGSPAQQAQALRRWTPAGHPELKVFMHSNGSDFSRLAQAPSHSSIQALATMTVAKASSLQISREEAAKIMTGVTPAMSGPVGNFWMGVLSSRASAVSPGWRSRSSAAPRMA